MIKALLFFTLLFTHTFVMAAKAASFTDFLFAEQPQWIQTLYQEKSTYLSDQIETPVLWEKLEFRYDMNRLDGETQQFELRMQPANFFANQSAKDFFKSKRNYFKLKDEALKIKILQKRYSLLIDKVSLDNRTSENNDLKALELERINYLTQTITNENFDPRELLNSQEELLKLKNDSIDLIRRKEKLTLEIKSLTSVDFNSHQITETPYPSAKLIPFDHIIEFINLLDTNYINSSIKQKTLQSRLDIELKESELVDYESRSFLSHFKLGYEYDTPKAGDRTSFEKKQWFAGVGIEIPFGNNSFQKQLNQKMNIAERKVNLLEQQIEISEDLEQIKAAIQVEALQAKQIQNYLSQIQNGQLKEALDLWTQSNPLLLIEQKASIIKRRADLRQFHLGILSKYIDILALSSMINQPYNILEKLPK